MFSLIKVIEGEKSLFFLERGVPLLGPPDFHLWIWGEFLQVVHAIAV